MGWTFVSGYFIPLEQFPELLFEHFQPAGKFCHILLLPENFLAEALYGLVLLGD